MPQYPAKNSLVGPANVTDGTTTVGSAQVITFVGATVTQTASNRATVTNTVGGTGLSGLTSGQVPIANGATTANASRPVSGSTTSGAVIVSASSAAKTSGHLATWDANGGLVDGGAVPTAISGLTTNVIPKASSATAIANSSISDNGTSVTIAEPLILTGQTSTPGAAAGTLTNAPAIGDPQTWLQVSINGVVHFIPAWHV